MITDQEEFEAWAGDANRRDMLPLDKWDGKGQNGGYKDTRTYISWYTWQACHPEIYALRAVLEAERGKVAILRDIVEEAAVLLPPTSVLHEQMKMADSDYLAARDARIRDEVLDEACKKLGELVWFAGANIAIREIQAMKGDSK